MLEKDEIMLRDEIERVQNYMADKEPDSEEYRKALDSLAKLHELKVTDEKVDAELAKTEIEESKAKADRKWRWVDVGLKAAGLLTPILSYGFWMSRVMKFEETGRCSSTAFRSIFNRGIPMK